MNNQRDGFMRYTITKSKVNYWPNRFHNVPPAGETKNAPGTLISFEQKVEGIKTRLNGPKFKEYYNQAQLFVNSLSRTPHFLQVLI
jgi:catalase